MIKLNKMVEPAILTTNKVKWTTQLRTLQNSNQAVPKSLATSYNHNDVKNSLRAECNSKCMYCESKVEHISDLHIEHIKPKAKDKFPDLTFEYTNLGLACGVCNRNKSSKYDNAIPFINPYIDEPSNHFNFFGVLIWAKSGDDRAKLTENELDLNRPSLIEARGDRLKVIRGMIDSYNIATNLTIKDSIKKQIFKEIENDKIYSFCCKALVKLAI